MSNNRRQSAINDGYLAISLLHVCVSAAKYAEEFDNTPDAAHMHSYVAKVLEHTAELTGEMLSVLEISTMNGEVTT